MNILLTLLLFFNPGTYADGDFVSVHEMVTEYNEQTKRLQTVIRLRKDLPAGLRVNPDGSTSCPADSFRAWERKMLDKGYRRMSDRPVTIPVSK